jgi:hypothetical protein
MTIIFLPLAALMIIFPVLTTAVGQGGNAGDEEGEFYGGKWPDDVPKPAKVEFYLPFPAGKTYGQMPSPHSAAMNKHAIDFGMPMRSPISASADGWVMKAIESGPDSGGQQNCLALQHADGTVTWYLHLAHKGVVPKLGEFVFAGDIVAYSGSSGTSPPHLHYSQNTQGGALSVPCVFVEGKSASKWVSQNKTFDQRYEKELKTIEKLQVGVVMASKLGFFAMANENKGALSDLKKPDKTDHPRYSKVYAAIQESAGQLDNRMAAFAASIQSALSAGKQTEAAGLAAIGAVELKGTQYEKTATDVQAELAKIEDQKPLTTAAKEAESDHKKLGAILAADMKSGKTQKIYKDYSSYVSKCADQNAAAVIKERMQVLKNRIDEQEAAQKQKK